jgi:hypothetical protein
MMMVRVAGSRCEAGQTCVDRYGWQLWEVALLLLLLIPVAAVDRQSIEQ